MFCAGDTVLARTRFAKNQSNDSIPYTQDGKVPYKNVRCKPQGSFAHFGHIPHLGNLASTNAGLESKLYC